MSSISKRMKVSTFKRLTKRGVGRTVPKPVKSYVKRQIKSSGDKMYKDYTNASGTAMGTSIGDGGTTTPIVYELTRIPSGSALEQKEGSSILMTGIRIKGILTQAAVGESNIVRCVVFTLKDPPVYGGRTFTALAGKLWGTGSGTSNFLYDPFVPHESTILWDKTWLFQGAQNNAFAQDRLIDKYIPMKKKIIYTKDALTVGANEARNPVFILWVSDSSVAPNPGFEGGMVRVYYRDQ